MLQADVGGSLLRLKLPNRRDAVETARQSVLTFLEPHALSQRTVFAVELVLEEALMNVISYAFQDDAWHEIDLTVQIEGGDVVLRIEDGGIAFDPLQVPERTPPASIDEAVPGGLGIRLVRRFASSAAYERLGKRNVLTVRVART
jgi:anti-sigma regulatory factor (Ser/Thr protein kinase)